MSMWFLCYLSIYVHPLVCMTNAYARLRNTVNASSFQRQRNENNPNVIAIKKYEGDYRRIYSHKKELPNENAIIYTILVVTDYLIN